MRGVAGAAHRLLPQLSSYLERRCHANTGIASGTISNGAPTFGGTLGWIEVNDTNQAVIGVGGDSGSPRYLDSGTSSSVMGVGVHTAGDSVPGPSSVAIYMPSDYIDDHNSTVNTIKQ